MRIFIGMLFISLLFINVYEAKAYLLSNFVEEVSEPIGLAHPQINYYTKEISTFATAGCVEGLSCSDISFGQASISGDLYLATNERLYIKIIHEGELSTSAVGAHAASEFEFNIELIEGWSLHYVSNIAMDDTILHNNIYYENNDSMTYLMDYRDNYGSTWFSINLVPGSYHFSYSMSSEAYIFDYNSETCSEDGNCPFAESDFSHTGSVTFYDNNSLPELVPEGAILEIAPQQAPAPVPEPATTILFGIGVAGLAAVSRRKKS